MRLVMSIKMETDAFKIKGKESPALRGREVAEILRNWAQKCEEHGIDDSTLLMAIDAQGNKVGVLKVEK